MENVRASGFSTDNIRVFVVLTEKLIVLVKGTSEFFGFQKQT